MKRKTKHEIIDEVANFYNLKNRSVEDDESTNCLYNGPNGKQCAFARMCIDPTRLTEGISAISQLAAFGDSILKEEYRGHEPYFYNAVQCLHDAARNWTEEGLSYIGRGVVNQLKSIYPND